MSRPVLFGEEMSGFIFQDDIRRASLLLKKLFKEGAADKEDWNFLLNLALGLYGIPSLGLMCLTFSNASMSRLFIPLIIFSPVWLSLFLLKSFRAYLIQKSKWKTYGAVVLMFVTFLGFGGGGMGYVDMINALTSGKEVHFAAGKIERLDPRRRNGPSVDIFDGQSTIPNIPITDEEYATLRPGDYYVSNMRLGGLGYYYRWRIDSWNRSWEEEGMHHKDKDLK